KYITQLGEGRWVLDGRLPIEDVQSLDLPVPESDEYDTIAGWVLVRLGHIPLPGERVVENGVTFTVQTVRRRRIARLLVQRSTPE
ncbi:MAG: HlyC/CorC family transporter, partial [Actinobacteria bacterium HGW-Actinobacteria-10]